MGKSITNMVSDNVVTLYGDRWLLIYHGDHFIMYANVEALCSTPETNIISTTFQLKKKNQRLVSDHPCPSPVNRCQKQTSCCIALYKLSSIPDILLDFNTKISFLSLSKKKLMEAT